MKTLIATAILFVVLGATTVLSMTTQPARSNDPPVADTFEGGPPALHDLNDFDLYI